MGRDYTRVLPVRNLTEGSRGRLFTVMVVLLTAHAVGHQDSFVYYLDGEHEQEYDGIGTVYLEDAALAAMAEVSCQCHVRAPRVGDYGG